MPGPGMRIHPALPILLLGFLAFAMGRPDPARAARQELAPQEPPPQESPPQEPPPQDTGEEPALWVTYEPLQNKDQGLHVVFLAGDEEYRSEEALPMLARILAKRHGIRSTVLFSIDPETGVIDPTNQTNLPGLELLDEADLMVVAWRFREPPDDAMRHFVDYVEAHKPIVGLRTATHALRYTRNRESPYARYSFDSEEWPGGFGKQILGETWVAHYGVHGHESTLGVVEQGMEEHPILAGVEQVWGPTDVYRVRQLPDAAQVLMRGQILRGMSADRPPVGDGRNDPMMPLIWLREIEHGGEDAPPQRVVCSTIGSSTDFQNEGLRRVIVNSCLWALGYEDAIGERINVRPVGAYKPLPFGFGRFKRGVRPADLALR